MSKKVTTTLNHYHAAIDIAVNDVANELKRAMDKHPLWQRDLCYAFAIVQEEIGETQREVVQFQMESEPHQFLDKRAQIRKEAVEATAMCLRFLAHLDLDPISHPILDKD